MPRGYSVRVLLCLLPKCGGRCDSQGSFAVEISILTNVHSGLADEYRLIITAIIDIVELAFLRHIYTRQSRMTIRIMRVILLRYTVYLIAALAWVAATPALASEPVANVPAGFAHTDLTKLESLPATATCNPASTRVEPKRLTYMCRDCGALCGVDVLISTSIDGTEGRFRSGETTIAKMQSLCQSREPNCTLERLDVNGAVGWVSRTVVLGNLVSTTILFRGGDVLTIRSMSDDAKAAYDNGKAVCEAVAMRIIGTQ